MNSTRKNLLMVIKSRGHWSINFRPLADQRLEFNQCKELIEKCSVELRGWDYPHFPRRRGDDTDLVPGNNYFEGWINWGAHKEVWRMYQSGQFIHFLAMEEDWFSEDSWYSEELRKKYKPGEILSIISTTYFVTEIFAFASRLAQGNLYKEGLKIIIQLNNILDRRLEILDAMRVPLLGEYKTGADKIEFVKVYDWQELTEKAQENALEAIIHIFRRFGWENPPIHVIQNDQEKLLMRRL